MLQNYIKLAYRNLVNNRIYSALNIGGLAVGMATCLLITLYIMDELSYDRFNTKADRIYRVNSSIKFGGSDGEWATVPDPLGPTLKHDYPQVEQTARMHQVGAFLVKRTGTTNPIRENTVIYADSTLFDVFTLPFVSGDPKRALVQPNTMVISESAARRHFGNQNPVGQTLLLNNKQVYQVTGVMRDIPANSHFHTDFLLAMVGEDYQWNNWLSNNYHTYIVLKSGTDVAALAKNLMTVADKYLGPPLQVALGSSMAQFRKAGNRYQFTMTPLTDIHLRSKRQVEIDSNGDIQYIYIFSAVGLFILLIACINFMNLATAQSAGRAKEVGIRKVLGSERSQLIGQFMAESVLMTTLAMLLALLIISIALPLFNQLSAKQLTVSSVLSPYWLFSLPALPLVVGLLAGCYPAFFLSSFRPIVVLKGALSLRVAMSGRGNVGLRSSLVVFQFMISVLLMVSTLVVYQQLTYIQTKNLGFQREQLLTVLGVEALGKQAEAFRQEVLQLPGVRSGTLSGYLPTPSNRSSTSFFPEGERDVAKGQIMQNWSVDFDYLKTLQMRIIKGRDFSRSFGSDSSAIILNESAAQRFGGNSIIGKRIATLAGNDGKNTTYTVIGIIKNFHYESLRETIGAVAFALNREQAGAATFRLDGTPMGTASIPALVKKLETKWKQLAPGQPFNYQFLDERFDQMYRTEQRVGSIALTFSGLAIFVACLGLFGLAAFTAEQRTKEIGVRKVLGASVASIVTLLSQDFLKLVLIAIVIASPIAWYTMNRWLQDFAYKIDITWWVFVGAGLLAVGIALLTVSFQSIRAALMNPVKSLRSE